MILLSFFTKLLSHFGDFGPEIPDTPACRWQDNIDDAWFTEEFP
jgi:hypothetical protein